MFLSFFSTVLSSATTVMVYLFFLGSVLFSRIAISPTFWGPFGLGKVELEVVAVPQLLQRRLALLAVGGDQAAHHAHVAIDALQLVDRLIELLFGRRHVRLHGGDVGRYRADLRGRFGVRLLDLGELAGHLGVLPALLFFERGAKLLGLLDGFGLGLADRYVGLFACGFKLLAHLREVLAAVRRRRRTGIAQAGELGQSRIFELRQVGLGFVQFDKQVDGREKQGKDCAEQDRGFQVPSGLTV